MSAAFLLFEKMQLASFVDKYISFNLRWLELEIANTDIHRLYSANLQFLFIGWNIPESREQKKPPWLPGWLIFRMIAVSRINNN